MQINADTIIDANRKQAHSEQDSFTIERYNQFASHLPQTCEVVIDVGCGTGRGGAAIKSVRPYIKNHWTRLYSRKIGLTSTGCL